MLVDINNVPELKGKQAFNVKTLDGKWYTVYTEKTLESVISEGKFDYIVTRKVG